MTELTDDELIVKIKTESPETSLINILKALAASVRWSAHADKKNCDDDNLFYLAELMEQIIPEEKQIKLLN